MKRTFTIVLLILTMFSLVALNLSDVIKTADSQRYMLLQGSKYVSDFKKNYVSFNADYSKSITSDEAKTLMTYRDRKDSITYDEAISDVDLYFRLLRYRMGHYDSLGGDEVFYQARDNVYNKLEKYRNRTISTSVFSEILISELYFIDDCHFSVDGHQVYYEFNTNTLKYVTYLSGLDFLKDDTGYYIEKKSKRYYYQSCDNSDTMIVPTLSDNGELVYSLVLYCPPANKPNKTKVTLSNNKTETVTWTKTNTNYVTNGFTYKEIDNIAYVGLTFCGSEVENSLYKIAKQAREKDIVVVDLRSNCGTHAYEFFKGYIDSDVSINEVALSRVGMTNSDNLKEGNESVRILDVSGSGSLSKCDNLTIVLVDNNTGCAPEEFSQFFRFITNTVIIGTNTMGHLDGGTTTYGEVGNGYDQIHLHLPNSGIEVQISTNLALYGDYESMVGKGFLPDVYVDDTTKVLNYVASLLENEGLVSHQTASNFITKTRESIPLPLYDEDKSVEVKAKNSVYGTYYEVRMTITSRDDVGSFYWSNPDTTKKYRIEISSSATNNVYMEVLMTQKNHTGTGCELSSGDMKTCEPFIWNNNTIYGTASILEGNVTEPFDVIYRFFPTSSEDSLHWTNYTIDRGDTRCAVEIFSAKIV